MTPDTVLTISMESIHTKLKGVTPEVCLAPHFLQVMLKDTKSTLTHNQKKKLVLFSKLLFWYKINTQLQLS